MAAKGLGVYFSVMTSRITLLSPSGAPLNARIDAAPGALILHGRSGTDRNRDYREALETILWKLDASQKHYEIFLDSQRVQAVPLGQRRLEFSRKAPVADRFNDIIRAMNAGTSSNGAWRRIRIEVSGATETELAAIFSEGHKRQSGVERLPSATLRRVKPEHIDRAVARLLAGEDAPNFGPSTFYDLLAPNGTLLAPKKVFGLALEEALGIEAGPDHFSAGPGHPSFQLLEAAGYPILPKGELVLRVSVGPADDDLALAEVSPKLRSHLVRERKPALAAAKRRAMLAELGYLRCERCNLVASDLGPEGDAVIEVHHAKVAVSEMADGHVTRLSERQCLCANCHRIVHRQLLAS